MSIRSRKASTRRGPGLLRAAAVLLAVFSTALACGPNSSPSKPAEGTVAGGADIPDTQVYLTYKGPGFSIQYPEGWTQLTSAGGVTFKQLDNKVAVTIVQQPLLTLSQARQAAVSMSGATVTTQPHPITLPAGQAILWSYKSQGPPDPVTGKVPNLSTDHYEVGGTGKHAVIELADPIGVDNVDAYKQIAQSFMWG